MSKDIREYRAEIIRDIVGFLEHFNIPELTIILGECFKVQTAKELSTKLKEINKNTWIAINDIRAIAHKPIKLVCEDLEPKIKIRTPAFSDERLMAWRKGRNNDEQQ